MANATLISYPCTYSVVNTLEGTGMFFQLGSTASNLVNFKYYFNVNQLNYANSGVLTNLGNYPVPPAPTTGNGLYSVARTLKSVIGYNLQPTILTCTVDLKSYAKYQVHYGFSYNPNVQIFDVAYVPVGGGVLGLYVINNSSTFPYDLQIGDVINYSKNFAGINDVYGGTQTIATITGTYSMYIDVNANPNYTPSPIVGSTVSVWRITTNKTNYSGHDTITGYDGGVINYVQRFTGTSSVLYGFNGTRQYDQNNLDFGYEYLYQPNYTFLTTYGMASSNGGNTKPINLGDWETAEFFWDSAPGVYQENITTYDADMNGLNSYNFTMSAITSTYSMWMVPTGTSNLTLLGVNFTGVSFYDININGLLALERRINLNCSIYTPTRIAWLNPLGAFEYWTFTLDSKQILNTAKTEFKQVLPFNYTVGARGRTVLASDSHYSYVVNSDWISEYDYKFLEIGRAHV